ncbi:hypothetical protein STSP1_01709 [Sedimentisphaera salicampi]|uniref:Uncharacterized protein n=1 Tax=Sedimentisphaera salicampi TaxID=1941349 RepID=A0A1W6LK67_9BACT|nr:hypothetical protein STSP1_00517 [Sedimentisphaera salicampi]ARN57306.1 hypothetical protein STSP1_01709 [Sedimentisphaera salicampi]
MTPAKHQYTVLKQICQHIPTNLVSKNCLGLSVLTSNHEHFRAGLTLYLCFMSRLLTASR